MGAKKKSLTDRLQELIDVLGRLLNPVQPLPAPRPVPVRPTEDKRRLRR
jgi:hypothetical protein